MRLNTLKQVQPVLTDTILKELKHLDLSGRLTFENSRASGIGAFSEVFEGSLRHEDSDSGDMAVAVKRLRFHVTSMDCRKLFEQEICVWAKLRHENVLPLLGYAFCPETSYPVLVSKWMTSGTLWSYVTSNQHLKTLDFQRLTWNVANGLAYLHEKNVIHSDIKADNIVVSPQETAMICDFGCSRMEAASRSLIEVTSTPKGTDLFWAPELIDADQSGKHSKETDVWAFGMTIYEIFHRKRPYGDSNQMQILIKILKGVLPAFESSKVVDESTYTSVTELCLMCWRRHPRERPTMEAILTHRLFASTPPNIASRPYSPAVPVLLLFGGSRSLDVGDGGNSLQASDVGQSLVPSGFSHTAGGHGFDDDNSTGDSDSDRESEHAPFPDIKYFRDLEYQEAASDSHMDEDDQLSAPTFDSAEEELPTADAETLFERHLYDDNHKLGESHSKLDWDEWKTRSLAIEDEDTLPTALDYSDERASVSPDYVAATSPRHTSEDNSSVASELPEAESSEDMTEGVVEDNGYEYESNPEEDPDERMFRDIQEPFSTIIAELPAESDNTNDEYQDQSSDWADGLYGADDAYSVYGDGGAYEADNYYEHRYDSEGGW